MLNHSNYMQMNAQLFNELSTQQCENVSSLRSTYIRVPRGFNRTALNKTVHTVSKELSSFVLYLKTVPVPYY